MSTKEYLDMPCRKCGHNIKYGQVEGEMYSYDVVQGEWGYHLFDSGCENAKKRLISEGKLPEPELVY